MRGRVNAWFLDMLDDYMHRKYGALKARLFSDVPPTVVEVGAGTGANLRYYPHGTRLIAIEPNVHMHARLRQKACVRGIDLDLRASRGESVDLPDASVDFVCTTLTLCTVSEPLAVVTEMRRILRPGGRFVCVEHVAAPRTSHIAGLQRLFRRPWRWLFEGCDLCRDTEALLQSAGFGETVIERLELPTLFIPVRFQIAVSCRA